MDEDKERVGREWTMMKRERVGNGRKEENVKRGEGEEEWAMMGDRGKEQNGQ